MDVLPVFEPGFLQFGTIPCFQYSGNLKTEVESGRITKERALDFLRWGQCGPLRR